MKDPAKRARAQATVDEELDTPESGRVRTRLWPPAAVIAACTILYVLAFDSLQIGQHVDDGIYVSVGRSLAEGLGYVRYEDPRLPFEQQYPPGLPALVALVLRLGGDLETLRIIPLAFSLLSLLLADAYFRTRLPCAGADPNGHWRWLLLALFGLNHLIVGYAGMLMTEAPFVSATLAALLLLTPAADGGASVWSRARIVAIALALTAACLFRTTGLAIVLGATLWLLMRRQVATGLTVAGLTGLLLSPWLILQRQMTGRWFGAGYAADIAGGGDSLAPQLLRPLENLLAYATTLLPEAVLPCFGQQVNAALAKLSVVPLSAIAGLIVTCAVIAGGLICARRRSLPDGWVFGAVMLLLLSWPFRYTRFILPVLPIVLVYLFAAAVTVAPRRRYLLVAVAGILLAGFLVRDLSLITNPPQSRYPELRATGEFIRTHTEPDALLIAPNPSGIALYAMRMTIDPAQTKLGPPASAAASINERLAAGSVYLLEREDGPSREQLPADGVRVFRVEPVAADAPDWPGLYRLRPAE